MTEQEAAALALFVKDHDTRYLAKSAGEGDAATVELTTPDGQVLEPVRTVAEFEDRFVLEGKSNASIEEAWKKWKP